MELANILIVDDHPAYGGAINSMLSAEEWVGSVTQVYSGVECLSKVQDEKFDLVIMDLNMPELDGIECMRILKQSYPDLKVVALTSYEEQGFFRRIMSYGADGYVVKSATSVELVKGFYNLIKDNIPFVSEQLLKNSKRMVLTPREIQVITLIADEKNTKEIADALFISKSTVKNHRLSIAEKLKIKNIAGLVKWVIKNGFQSKPFQ